MTTAVQHRRGTTAEHSTFTGLEGEVTIDTTKDTAVIHDGALAGGYPLAKENLANANPTSLASLTGASTAADDQFLVYDTSIGNMKKISRAELNNAMTLEALDTVDINGGTIDGTAIGATTASTGAFTTLSASSSVTLSGATANGVAYANGSKVLTTGSALTFDGAILGVNGVSVGRGAGAVSTNTAVGSAAIASATSGAYNSGFGYGALNQTTTGSNNAAGGYFALAYNTTGASNTAWGVQALNSNTTASNNTAVGYQAGYSNTTGTEVAAFGLQSLYSNTTGYANHALGYASLFTNTTGSYNTAVGHSALNKNTTASYNTAVGYQAGYSNTTGDVNVFMGRQAGYGNTTGAANNAFGDLALYTNSTGGSNNAFGRQALYFNTTGNYNTALGHTALYSNTTASNNTAVGANALRDNTTGADNTALGTAALILSTTGSNNTAIGREALLSNTTASNNTAVGYQAGYGNTTGAGSTLLGAYAGYQLTGADNTAVGSNSGRGISTGAYGVFIGPYTGGYNGAIGITGSLNVNIGYSSGQYMSGAANLNTYVGSYAGQNMTTGSKNTILGPYNGNQGGLDIRTASNYIVLSDGDGNPNMAGYGQTEWLMRSGNGYWTVYSNGGGNNSTYNGTLIGANKTSITAQSNTTLPSWFIDIGGRAADGSTRPVSTADKFSVGRQAAGGTLIGAANLFEVNANGAVGLNTTAASTGTGITFPATQSASSDANTLDDYEEGSWTPVLTEAGTNRTPTYQSQGGRYVKIGNTVYCQFGIALTNKGSGSGSGQIRIEGLPFTGGSFGSYQEPTVKFFGGGFTTATTVNSLLQVAGGTAYLRGWLADNAGANVGATATPYTEVTDNSYFAGEIFYNV